MCLYLRTKFRFLAYFRRVLDKGIILPPPLPHLKKEPLKSPPRLGLNILLLPSLPRAIWAIFGGIGKKNIKDYRWFNGYIILDLFFSISLIPECFDLNHDKTHKVGTELPKNVYLAGNLGGSITSLDSILFIKLKIPRRTLRNPRLILSFIS